MTRWLAALMLLFLCLAPPVQAQGVTAADEAEIRGVIERQLQAFRRDDGQTAFAQASPLIQRLFGDPATFLGMVQTGYPPVYRAAQVEFQALEWRNGVLIQQVRLVGPDGLPAIALYEMERQADGAWRINGCALVRAPDLTT
ncbi:DUF4864 domain-containing protein [Oceanibaculum pacificum]|nr:DUF4864 domain-containing protein [Oceanibaculum pacificum]